MEKLCWTPMDLAQAQQCYEQNMIRDFPPEELKPFAAIRHHWMQGRYEAWGWFSSEGELQAYAFLVWAEKNPLVLLDYYAVLPGLRGKGMGSGLLLQLTALCRERFDGILIECEDPEFSAEPDMARRRMGFYSRAGAVWPGWASRVFDGRYLLCWLPCKEAAGFERSCFARLAEQTYRAVIPQPYYDKGVKMYEKPAGRSPAEEEN